MRHRGKEFYLKVCHLLQCNICFRLSDEEAKWFEERTAYESVISEMKKSMAELERRFKDDAQDAVHSLRFDE